MEDLESFVSSLTGAVVYVSETLVNAFSDVMQYLDAFPQDVVVLVGTFLGALIGLAAVRWIT